MVRTYPIRLRSSRKRTVCGCFCRIGSGVDGTPMNGLIFSRRRAPFFQPVHDRISRPVGYTAQGVDKKDKKGDGEGEAGGHNGVYPPDQHGQKRGQSIIDRKEQIDNRDV